ncbi:RadC family protein [Jiulongibacter sp. NS-SX5]|uniref:RadC family protein n=1 Tax=Jiulongibacter sp. NS-SX5 TaxID=3463854 RepID=UPI00405A1617
MESTKNSITSWAEEDRPREKLLLQGRSSLTDSEIIAILIGSGSSKKSAVELSREILSFYDNDLNKLAKASVKDLMRFKGIGEAKAISIVAALELGRRRKNAEPLVRKQLLSPDDAYEFMKPFLLDLPHEEFWVILLDAAAKPIKTQKVSSGGVSMVVADPKLILKIALENLAYSIVLVHNHPSGQLRPSKSDLNLTDKIKNAAKFMDIILSDHIIFTDHGFYSFSTANLL